MDGDPAREHHEPEQGDGQQENEGDPGQGVLVRDHVEDPHVESDSGEREVAEDDRDGQMAAAAAGTTAGKPDAEHVEAAEGGGHPGEQCGDVHGELPEQ
ncbi:hypothetical protein ACFWWT_35440 [Streptomyces sp. NPDC058676]|uniref:hypothetical protein n=1 Tax=unclassified Streptomyces TaxID=2593676 RepID=UPI003664D938